MVIPTHYHVHNNRSLPKNIYFGMLFVPQAYSQKNLRELRFFITAYFHVHTIHFLPEKNIFLHLFSHTLFLMKPEKSWGWLHQVIILSILFARKKSMVVHLLSHNSYPKKKYNSWLWLSQVIFMEKINICTLFVA